MELKFTYPLALLFLIASCTQAPVSDKAKVSEQKEVNTDTLKSEVLNVDPAQSKIEWRGTKVSGYHTGTINIKNGQLNVQDNKIIGGKFIIDMNTLVVSGPAGSQKASNAKLQKHLTGVDFFDVTAHPEAVFEITEVTPYTGKVEEEENDPSHEEINEYKITTPTHMVSGNLTIKNITKNIKFPARINVTPSYAEAVAKFNIDRTLWDINYAGQADDLIRKEIHLGISLMATRPKT